MHGQNKRKSSRRPPTLYTCGLALGESAYRRFKSYSLAFEVSTSGTCFAYLRSRGPTFGLQVNLVGFGSHLFNSSWILKHFFIMKKQESVPNILNCTKKQLKIPFPLFHKISIKNKISCKILQKHLKANQIVLST